MTDAVIFLHIAKAGGTTFERLLTRYYPAEETYALDNWDTLAAIERLKNTQKSELAHVRLLKGHMPFGLHKVLPRPARYITFLRDPVERMLSLWYFILRTPGHYLYDSARAPGMDLGAFFSQAHSPELDNGMVKAISGNFTHYGCCQRGDLELAQRHIEQYFAAVGITERYDESLLLMKHALGWRGLPLYEKANVTEGRPKAGEVDPSALDVIRRVNALDIELYDWALERHRQQVARAGWRFAAERAWFGLRNGPL